MTGQVVPSGNAAPHPPGSSPEGPATDPPPVTHEPTATITPVNQPELSDTAPHEPPAVRCRMCGHLLHDRASRLWGLGPDCRARLRLRTARDPGVFEVEQDTIPGT